MKKQDFIDMLCGASWSALCDAQHDHIEKVWRELFPTHAALEDMEYEKERLEELLVTIGDLAHDNSTGPGLPDILWEIRRMAYRQ